MKGFLFIEKVAYITCKYCVGGTPPKSFLHYGGLPLYTYIYLPPTIKLAFVSIDAWKEGSHEYSPKNASVCETICDHSHL